MDFHILVAAIHKLEVGRTEEEVCCTLDFEDCTSEVEHCRRLAIDRIRAGLAEQ